MSEQIDASRLAGTHDILFLTIDTLRHDVATQALADGQTPFLQNLLPNEQWEERHTPGSFTYAAHHAFFAGFLPTPARPGHHERLFATRFEGSQTTSDRTLVLDAPDIVRGLSNLGYLTMCIGGVGFFNKQTPLSSVFPDLFEESYWHPEFSVADRKSTEHQIAFACDRLAQVRDDRRVFLFVNIAACHQPNCHYLKGATEDSPKSQAAALSYVDTHLPPLVQAMTRRAPLLLVICSDHGTAYGEDGYSGHRLGHPVVWTVPYMETVLAKGEDLG